jgi:hypothetical protein
MYLWALGAKWCPGEEADVKQPRRRVPAFKPGSGQWLFDTCTMWRNSDGSFEELLSVENGLVELNREAHSPKILYTARTLDRIGQDISMEALHAAHRKRKVKK